MLRRWRMYKDVGHVEDDFFILTSIFHSWSQILPSQHRHFLRVFDPTVLVQVTDDLVSPFVTFCGVCRILQQSYSAALKYSRQYKSDILHANSVMQKSIGDERHDFPSVVWLPPVGAAILRTSPCLTMTVRLFLQKAVWSAYK